MVTYRDGSPEQFAITPTTNWYDPGSHSVFVPAATRQLHVEFSRNPLSFPVMKYMQLYPEKAVQGLYAELSSTSPIRVVSQADHLWADGTPRPRGTLRPMRWRQWRQERRTYPYALGNLTVEQAPFDVIAAHGRSEAARAMTDRTIDTDIVLTTAATWGSNTAATIAALLGAAGSWTDATATDANQFIKKGFNAIKRTIARATGGVVTGDQLICRLGPVAAGDMATSDEIRTYMKNHEQSLAVLAGADRRIVDDWGLPPVLYGVQIVIEDAVRTTTRQFVAGTATTAYVAGDDDAVFLSRVGGLVGPAGGPNNNAAPSFSTLAGFFNEELNVETITDAWDRMTMGSVTDTRDIVLTAPDSGFWLQDINA